MSGQAMSPAEEARLLEELLDQVDAPVQAPPAPRVRSTPAAPRPEEHIRRRRRRTAVLSGATVDVATTNIIRTAAGVMLVASFIGSIAALNGGWEPVVAAWPRPWEGLSLSAALAGVLIQGWLTVVQLNQRRRKLGLLYLSHLIPDVGLTAIGYAPVVLPFLMGGFTRAGLAPDAAFWLAGGILLGGAVSLAMVPEHILID